MAGERASRRGGDMHRLIGDETRLEGRATPSVSTLGFGEQIDLRTNSPI